MHYKEFITKYTDKYLDWDGVYGAQCVDLFRYFCNEVLGIGQPKGVDGAKDFWTNYPSDPNLYNNFERIDNAPSFVPQPGDVWIWNAGYGKCGHVAIESYATATTSKFQCFSQNDPKGSPCSLKDYKYTNVYGVLRPKKQRNIRDDLTTSQSSSHSSSLLERDEMKTLEFLGCKDFGEAERKLIEHLGIKGDKCAWGTDDGDGTGGFLGSERRTVKTLENQINTLDDTIIDKNKTIDSLQAQVTSLKSQLDEQTDSYTQEYVLGLEKQIENQARTIQELQQQLINKEQETKKGVVSKLLQLLGL